MLDENLHWEYTEKIIQKVFELVELAYKEGMKHGYKHGTEDRKV